MERTLWERNLQFYGCCRTSGGAVPGNSREFVNPKSPSGGNTGKGGASRRPDAGNSFGGVSHGGGNTGSAAAGTGVAAGRGVRVGAGAGVSGGGRGRRPAMALVEEMLAQVKEPELGPGCH